MNCTALAAISTFTSRAWKRPHLRGRPCPKCLGPFAEFERSLIKERVKAGLERAKAKGTRWGRPPVPERTKDRVLEAHSAGMSLRKIAREVGVSVGTVHNLLKDAAQ